MPKFLNLGCGSRFCGEDCWTNVDFHSTSDRVISHNLLQGFPFSDETFDVVYHSHVLEHFNSQDGARFIRECYRVLKPGGILRVAVPDLEQICRLYLEGLENLKRGDTSWQGKYDWIKLEMYDQTIRTESGGDMAQYLQQPNVPDKEFIIARIGTVARDMIEANPASSLHDITSNKSTTPAPRRWLHRSRQVLKRPSAVYGRLRKLMLSAILNRHERQALAVGLFRLGGEIHQWMYDRYSLLMLLQGVGFREIRQCSATESRISNWGAYFLDVDPNGREHAPSSLYMESDRPR